MVKPEIMRTAAKNRSGTEIHHSPAAERQVYDFTGSSAGRRVGPLYDVLYDALVQVIAGPDAAAMLK